MAREDYTGVNEVAPDLQAANDTQRIEANPSDFGGQIAAAGQDIGANLNKTANFYGTVAADNATNNFLDQSNKILYGDPGKMVPGPDGKPTPDTGFYGMRGADAMRARPEVEAQLQDLIAEQRENLDTPEAQQQFEVASRRYRAQESQRIGEFADKQQTAWATDTNTTTATIGLNGVSRVAGDDAAVAPFAAQVQTAYVKNAQLQYGLDPTVKQGAILKANQDIAEARIRALIGNNDAPGAQRVFTQSQDILGSLPNYDQIASTVRNANYNAVAGPMVDRAVADAVNGATPTVPGAPFQASKPWGAGADLIRANPSSTIAQLAGVPVTITSAQRTAAENAAAHGSPTSEHLSGNAWDFVPKGISLQQAAANVVSGLHAQGVPFDQVEIDTANGHVHVGFGEKNRNEVIDQNGKPVALAGAPPSAASSSYLSALHGHESGGNPNAVNPTTGATGIDQVVGNTWYNPAAPQTSVMGQPEFAADIAGKTPAQIEAMRTDPAISDRATLVYAKMNAASLQNFGDPVNAATLGLAHGFGATGAHRILAADPSTPLAQVDPLAVRSNPNMANTTTGAVVQDYNRRFGTGAVDFNTGATSGASAQPAQPQGMSRADYLRENMPTLISNFRAQAEQQFQNQPQLQDEVTTRYQRALETQISQQDQQYLVDAHTVQSYVIQHQVTSEQELQADPNISQAWTRLNGENPIQAAGVEKMFDANAHGLASLYGVGFKGYLDRVLAPTNDPTRIKDPSGLWTSVAAGAESPLTNSGVNALSGLTAIRGTPSGEADAARIKSFVDQFHGELTFSNPGVGRYDEKGEAAYTKFMQVAIPELIAAQKNGTLSKVLDPNSPDYLGKAALPFMRTRAQMMRDAVTDPQQASAGAFTVQSFAQTISSLDNAQQRAETTKAAIANGRLKPQVYQAYLSSIGRGAPGSGAGAAAGAAISTAPPGPFLAPGADVPVGGREG